MHVEGKKDQMELACDYNKKLCDFFLSDRGCVKEGRCDFLHPKAPNCAETKRVCEYFGTRRGCVKEMRCDFLHLTGAARLRQQTQQQAVPAIPTQWAVAAQPAQQAYAGVQYAYATGWPAVAPPSASTGSEGTPGLRSFKPTQAQALGNTRVCNFYQEARGCAKQERCDFIHQGQASAVGAQMSMGQAPSPIQPQQAIQQVQHQQALMDPAAQYAAYYGSYGTQDASASLYSQGLYGAATSYANAYLAAPGTQEVSMGAAPQAGSASNGQRVCSFYLTARGCRKGTRCDFSHPADGGANGSAVGQAPKQSVRYSPY